VSNRRRLTVVGAALLSVALAAAAGTGHLADPVVGVRGAFYTAVASVAAALLGLLIATMAILLTLGDGPRIARLTHSPLYERVISEFFKTTIWLGLTLIVSLVALPFDQDFSASAPCRWGCSMRPAVFWPTLILLIASAVSLACSLGVLKGVLNLVAQDRRGDSPDPTPPPPSRLDPKRPLD
jgi:hypothetical protein